MGIGISTASTSIVISYVSYFMFRRHQVNEFQLQKATLRVNYYFYMIFMNSKAKLGCKIGTGFNVAAFSLHSYLRICRVNTTITSLSEKQKSEICNSWIIRVLHQGLVHP